ncbi:MAG: (d)CMP kinase [Sphingomicrobium sp.]
MQSRDERDAGRDAAPLVKADDAMLLDTSDMDVTAAIAAALSIVEGQLT